MCTHGRVCQTIVRDGVQCLYRRGAAIGSKIESRTLARISSSEDPTLPFMRGPMIQHVVPDGTQAVARLQAKCAGPYTSEVENMRQRSKSRACLAGSSEDFHVSLRACRQHSRDSTCRRDYTLREMLERQRSRCTSSKRTAAHGVKRGHLPSTSKLS